MISAQGLESLFTVTDALRSAIRLNSSIVSLVQFHQGLANTYCLHSKLVLQGSAVGPLLFPVCMLEKMRSCLYLYESQACPQSLKSNAL